ncbi:DUF1003 domain-containing protein [Spirosoma knui]
MENIINVLCNLSGESVAIEAAVLGEQLHPELLREINADFPAFSPNSYISLNRLLPYMNRCLDDRPAVAASSRAIAAFNPDSNLTFGQRVADQIADFGGSWTFILSFLGFIVLWMSLNAWWFTNRGFDPYPFILLNLVLSCLAALQAPVIMMSQNRQEERDRDRARRDYEINLKAEGEIRLLQEKVDMLLRREGCRKTPQYVRQREDGKRRLPRQ